MDTAAATAEKAFDKSRQLTVSTHQLPPTSTLSPSAEKTVDVESEIRRNSSVSTPSSAHMPSGFDNDIEAMVPARSCDNLNKTTTTNTGGTRSKADCSVWPGQDHWKQRARAAKVKNRSCQCMARLSKRTRLVVKIVIALLIVGIAIGVGLGISRSLGAGIWHPKDH
ncbi:hypothetical protein F4778DRAFT_36727 [Xylariomycetidae sp. FL2044]|nr:hypothetical protein F4778DRAFT_36727 [Xylariomycetidae sp. FL2044]